MEQFTFHSLIFVGFPFDFEKSDLVAAQIQRASKFSVSAGGLFQVVHIRMRPRDQAEC